MEQINKTVEYLVKEGFVEPVIGIVLGTGLGNLVTAIDIKVEIGYEDIPNFPVSTVESHKGKLIYGEFEGKMVVAMQGRFHYYEGYSMSEVTFPIRVMKLLGVKNLLISNAAGAINMDFRKGNLMLLDDHINLLPENPLRGKNIEELGPRFPDMSQPYDRDLNSIIIKSAIEENVVLHEGVYVSVPGPNMETRAEYRYLRTIGADAVGMSTVPEVIVANHMGLPCAAVSVLTDECDPDNLKAVSLNEILEIAAEAEKKMIRIFKSVCRAL
ncbi:purine-nucleoside phosphorylase [Marinilabiliaceae bacterium JC017]|nr:purine-nucleoside phosphorylase [Marinilabiliaceae bacterium JC017]